MCVGGIQKIWNPVPLPSLTLLEDAVAMDRGQFGIIDGVEIDALICEEGGMEIGIRRDDKATKSITNAEVELNWGFRPKLFTYCSTSALITFRTSAFDFPVEDTSLDF